MKEKVAIILQSFGVGDCIWSQAIAHYFIEQGYRILWPVRKQFVGALNRAYPDILFIDIAFIHIDFNFVRNCDCNGTKIVSLFNGDSTLRVPYNQVMQAKYMMYGLEWGTWKNKAMWVRDMDKELKLFSSLGLKKGEIYNLVNKTWNTESTGKIDIKDPIGWNVEMKPVEGYSLFDWAFVIENAANIHTVSTSILYILEVLNLQANEIHFYPRLPHEKDFKNVKFLFTKNYILHEEELK